MVYNYIVIITISHIDINTNKDDNIHKLSADIKMKNYNIKTCFVSPEWPS